MEILENSRNRRWMDGRTYLRKNLDSQNVLNERSEFSFYRKFIPLKNQKRVMLRFLNEGDRQDLISLFQTAPNEDLRFCKHDLKDLKLLNHWLDHLNSPRLLPLVAVSLEINQLIAAATLLRGKHTAHHIGEIKLFIAKPFRNLGLGSKMLEELMLLAAQGKLQWMRAEVITDQKQIIKTLRTKGFQIKVTLEDFCMVNDRITYDVALMMRALNQETVEF